MPYRTDPRMSGRHPFEILMLILAFVTGLPTLLGVAPRPGSLNTALPTWAVIGWSLTLVIGSGTALVGIALRKRATGLVLEQLGLALTGVAAVVYAATLAFVAGPNALISSGIIFGFGVSCLIRWKDLQEIIQAVTEADQRQKRLKS